jgi:flagellar hook assembly protein FlgD
VRALESGSFAAGRHVLAWDGRDESGRLAAPGVYFARVVSPLGNRSRAIVRAN